MEFGALQCVPKVQIVVFACLTIVVLRCKKKVDQLPENLRVEGAQSLL
jgi:hypothetical protein